MLREAQALIRPRNWVNPSTHVPGDVVCKGTYENKAVPEAASGAMRAFDPGVMAQADTVSYYVGAERCFKEARQWPPKKL